MKFWQVNYELSVNTLSVKISSRSQVCNCLLKLWSRFAIIGGVSSNQLLKVDLKLFDSDECTAGYRGESSLGNGIIESQICAGDATGQRDTCQVCHCVFPTIKCPKKISFFCFRVIRVKSLVKYQMRPENRLRKCLKLVLLFQADHSKCSLTRDDKLFITC